MVVAPTLLHKPSTPVKLSGREKLKTSDDYMKTRKWSGLTSMLLESHIDDRRNAFVNLTESATHVNYQLPNDRTRTTHFLNSLNSTDP